MLCSQLSHCRSELTCSVPPFKVARTWGDKVLVWLERSASDSILLSILSPVDWINVPASLISAACTVLLLGGVRESKLVTNLITAVKMLVVGLMVVGGFLLFYPSNMGPPFAPFGFDGVLRGATSSFFGYVRHNDLHRYFVCMCTFRASHALLDASDFLHSWGMMKYVSLQERQSTPNVICRAPSWER